jgi:asparagine synthase (glutamine-hydrolysing)
MCGIAGRYARRPLEGDGANALAVAFDTAVRSRGPDGTRTHHDADVLLVHRRLSIIDLSEAANQPLWNETGTVCVIVNGEIYNFETLRRDLERRGHRFHSRSDCEVLVHLYEDGGIEACCSRARGMFALALWDARSRVLYLVRDRLGIKPLVLAEHDEGVTFGSTVAAVLADADVPRDAREEAFVAFAKWGFVPTPWSAIRAVRHVSPGTYVAVRMGRVVDERRWWTDSPDDATASDADVRQALADAVAGHLVADVGVGALLSAGIDSGIVTALGVRASPTLEAWTVSNRGEREDEFGEAGQVAAHLGVRHHDVTLGGDGLSIDDLDDTVRVMDEPLGVSSLVALNRLYRAIAPFRRVVLSGDGGDELFAGYGWHAGMPVFPRWSATSVFRIAAPTLSRLAHWNGTLGAVARVAALSRRHPASLYLDKLRVTSDASLRALGVDPNVEDPTESVAIAAWDRFSARGPLESMLAVDRATALVDEMLAKVDVASMAHRVEARVPLLADDVVEVAKRLPAHRKRQGEVGKICLREWFGELAPPALAWREKTGFNSPVDAWMRSAVGDELRERARAGLSLLGGAAGEMSSRLTFALAVLGSWADQRLGPPLGAMVGAR